MKYWDDFMPEVLPYVENCPAIVAKNHVKNAAIEFCQRSAVWKKTFDPITVSKNIAEYDITTELSTNEAVSALDFCYLTTLDGEYRISTIYDDRLKATGRVWQTVTALQPSHIFMIDTENVRLYPIPEQDYSNGLVIGVVLKPSRSAAGVPDWIFEQYAEAIAHGAKARLMGMKGRDWYAPNEGLDEQADFDRLVKDATIRANKGNSRNNISVYPRPFA